MRRITLCPARELDLRAIPPELLLAALAAALILALIQTLRIAFRRYWQRRTLARYRERGALGEARAESMLRAQGYRILGRQVAVAYELLVDDAKLMIDLRADYLVSIEGRRYVAEVKTGRVAPRLDTSSTRRQLLEYRVAFDVDGVLLVDAEAGRIHAVVFPLHLSEEGREVRGGRLVWLLAGLVLGITAAAVLLAG